MMQTMRKSAKIIFFIVLVTFVGFMAYSGVLTSMASKNRAKSGANAPPGVIGIVNGTDISNYQFDDAYRKRIQNLTKDDHEPTDAEMEQARNDIWNNMTTMTLLEQEAKRHGLVVSDRDVANYMRQAPPKDIIESKDFATDGQFDLTKYQSWLQQLAVSPDPRAQAILSDFDTQIRQQLLVTRVQDFVLSMVRVTDNDIKNDFIDKNDKVKVRYIFIPAGDYDSTITTVPESEVNARYEKDKDQFKQPEMAVYDYVQFPKTASEADGAEAKTRIDNIYDRLKSGADFAQLAKDLSEDPGSAKNGGDLGWFGEGRMVPEFWEATKSIQLPGQYSAPFKTQFGWHIVMMMGKKVTKDKEGVEKPEYQASHILIKVEPSTTTLAEIEQKANNFRIDAEKLGFKEAAQEYGLTTAETKPFGPGASVPTVGQNQALNDFAFTEKIGSISDVVSGRSAYYVLQINRRTPAGFTPYSEMKDRLEKTILREKKVEMAHKRGEELAQQLAGGKSLDQISAETGKPMQETDFFNRSQFVPKIGNDPDFTGAAFALSPSNPISKSVNARTGAYLMQFVDHQQPDSAAISAAVSDSLTNETLNSKRKDIWSKWLNSIKQNAKIEDFRSVYYGS